MTGGPEGAPSEASELQRVSGKTQRSEKGFRQLIPICDQRSHQTAISVPILAEAIHRLVNGMFNHNGPAVAERMRKRGGRLHPARALLRERQVGKERGGNGERCATA